ncbi:hypothetical protein BD413DRAFT_577520 [Trametes elegans]|nr:hypothetical protein BD413DRAFT_577520 [Trametes elegans]
MLAAHPGLQLSIKAVARVTQIATISRKAFFTMHPSTLPFGFPVDVPKFEHVVRTLCFAKTRRSATFAMTMVRNNLEEANKRVIADPKLAYMHDGTVVFSKNTEEQTIDTHPLIATTPEPTGTVSNPFTPAFHWSAASFIPATVFNPQDPYVLQSLYDARDKERITTPSEFDNDNAPERVSTTEVPSGDYNSTVDRPTEDIPPTTPDSATTILATENIATASAPREDDDTQPAQDDADTTLVSVPSYSDKSHAAPSAFVLGDVSDDSDSSSSPPSYASDDSSLAFDDESDADSVRAFKYGLRAAADADGAIDALVRDLAGLTVHDLEETIACDYAEAKTAGAFSVVITIDPASASESEAEFEADNEAETDEDAEAGGAEDKCRRLPRRIPISVSFQSFLPHPPAYSVRGSGSDSDESGYDSSGCESSSYAPDRTRLCLPELPPHLARNPFEFEAPPRGGEAGRAPTFAALMARPRKFKKSRRAGRKITARKNRLRAAGEFALLAALADVDVPWAEDVPLPEDVPGDWDEDEDGAEGDAEAVCETMVVALAVAGEVRDA